MTSFTDIFRIHARHRPTKAALVQGERIYSFAELDRVTDSICHALSAAGVRREQLVGVALKDTSEHLLVMIALARMGAVIQPIDCRWSHDEKETVLSHFGSDHFIAEAEDGAGAALRLVPEQDWYAGSDTPYEDPLVTYDSPMLLSLSSGTTGIPKGPRHTQRQFEDRFMVHWLDVGFNSQDRYVSATPLYFGGGRGFALSTLTAGGTVLLFPPPYSPQELIDYVAENEGSAIFLVPTLLRRLLQIEGEGRLFPSLRRLVSSGSALFMEEKQKIRDRICSNFVELYSATEGGSISLLGPEEQRRHPDSVGRACFRVEIQIVDDQHRPLGAGEIGRLRYRSPASAQGYYVGDSDQAFHDGWFYPGDLAMLNQEGYLFLRGRAKDMIIRGGVNIYPGDIEKVLLEIDGIEDAAVVGIPSPELGEEVAAFVVLGAPVTVEEMTGACSARLAPFKVPRMFRVVEALPKNAGGKVVKSELVKMHSEGGGG